MTTTQATDRDLGLKDSTYRVAMVTTDQMHAAANHLAVNWGEYGYKLGIVQAGWSSAIFGARCSDGSEFFFEVDRFGNVTDIPQG